MRKFAFAVLVLLVCSIGLNTFLLHKEHLVNERKWRTLEVAGYIDTMDFSVYSFKGTDTIAVVTSITSIWLTRPIVRIQCRSHPDSTNVVELRVYTADSPRPTRILSGNGIIVFDRRILDKLR